MLPVPLSVSFGDKKGNKLASEARLRGFCLLILSHLALPLVL